MSVHACGGCMLLCVCVCVCVSVCVGASVSVCEEVVAMMMKTCKQWERAWRACWRVSMTMVSCHSTISHTVSGRTVCTYLLTCWLQAYVVIISARKKHGSLWNEDSGLYLCCRVICGLRCFMLCNKWSRFTRLTDQHTQEIMRTVPCCIVYDSCAQWYTDTCEQFLNLHIDLGLNFIFVCLFRFTIYVFVVFVVA